MKIAMIGLGRMGANMARRLKRAGHDVVVHDARPEATAAIAAEGFTPAASYDELAKLLDSPRVAWVMVPAGEPTEGVVSALAERFAPGDVVVDGGNSYFKDDIRRSAMLASRGIHFVDAGTSGGVWGLERGYCLMVGGPPAAIDALRPALVSLSPGRDSAPPTPGRDESRSTAGDGWLHCGPAGAGHFVKMIHNGIEYGMMQSFAEGFEIMREATAESLPEAQRYRLDVPEIAELWRRGSVVGSWLLDLTAAELAKDPELASYSGVVQDSGEGRWTVMAAIDEAVPAEVLASALFARFRSRRTPSYADKVLSAMRHGFGGHQEAPHPTAPPSSSAARKDA
jgi:6-phosphogluconate dehydrogenase